MEVEIDFDRLRNDLIDYFGTALMNEYAMIDLINVENCSDNDLLEIASKNKFNLENYIIKRR